VEDHVVAPGGHVELVTGTQAGAVLAALQHRHICFPLLLDSNAGRKVFEKIPLLCKRSLSGRNRVGIKSGGGI
jgi:hypothetical protein